MKTTSTMRSAPRGLRAAACCLALMGAALAHGPGDRAMPAARQPAPLQPLFGALVALPDTGDAQEPDLAYAAHGGVFLTVWRRHWGGQEAILGQRSDAAGNPIGPTLLLTPWTSAIGRPKVAHIASRDAFVVVYQRDNGIFARAVTTQGALLAEITVAPGGETTIRDDPDIGGQGFATRPDHDNAVCVWANLTTGGLEMALLTVDSTPSLVRVYWRIMTTAGYPAYRDVEPAISKSGGELGQFLVVWIHGVSASNAPLRCATLSSHRATFAPSAALTLFPGVEGLPEVDGDGSRWLVAYTPWTTGQTDVYCSSVVACGRLGPPVLQSGPTLVEGKASYEDRPAVAFLGDSALVAYLDNAGDPGTTVRDVWVENIDVPTCGTCEPARTRVHLAHPRLQGNPALCARRSGGDPNDEVMIAFDETAFGSGNHDLLLQRFRPLDGDVTSLGGACGFESNPAFGRGSNSAMCARSPNGTFAFRLDQAVPNAPVLFVLGLTRQDLAFCSSSCTLVPAADITIPTATDACGRASVPMPIGGGVANVLTMYTQWLVVHPRASCFGADFSPALRITVQ
ncbi:MAG: hypothetical protein IPM29_00495 [Planctomycetes bacterium]|nr:hypothetical protein [Planctomycetota bacterium]